MENKKRQILIIEDDEFLRETLVRKFKKLGYRVSESITGEDGLEVLKTAAPDIIILDLILPGIDGFEVLKKIKEDERVLRIPVFILSNFGSQEDIERGLNLGAEDYVIKTNVSPSDVIKKVEDILKLKGS